MRLERRASAQCLLPVRKVFDEKTVRLKIIAQHGRESRVVFIGRELPEQMIREGFESCIVT